MKTQKIIHSFLFFFAFFIMFLSDSTAQKEVLVLNRNWKFSCNDSANYRDALVPGSVYTDLMQQHMIENPFVKDNLKDIEWIAEQTWTYTTTFDVSERNLKTFSNIELWFEGIDTYASIYLNDSLIMQTKNAFHPWFVDVKKFLKPNSNVLKVIFPPLIPILKLEASKYSFTLPEGLRVYARKPQFHFGWDFAPKILNISIFKPVTLRFWNGFSFENVSCQAKPENKNGVLGSLFFVRTENDEFLDFILQIKDVNTKKIWHKVKIKTSITDLRTIEIKVPDVEIWSVDHPNYYDLEFTLSHKKFGSQTIQKRIGFRNLSVNREADSIGTPFFFELNGNPVFSKGTNWVPMEVFQHQTSGKKYQELLCLAKDAGYNMIRIWGGGYYEDDAFYELCDSLGIMVWQDFMFACSMYPLDNDFVNSVKTEVDFQLRRISSHPSLALWCGNNENTEGWYNWGWQKQFKYSMADSAYIWNGNFDLFYKKIPEWCSFYNLPNNYHPSSPLLGWGRESAYKNGDVHYWGVWWGEEPFEKYTEKVGRFVSEYGFQSVPAESTLEYMMTGKLEGVKHSYIVQHQKHARGFQIIEDALKRDYFIPDSIREYIYLSQLQQSEGVAKAIVAHRLAMPYCMGTLFWQFNDCWPSISWSAVDYFNQPKALYFQTKRLFKDVAPLIIERNDSVLCYVSNLKNAPWVGKLIIGSFNAETKELHFDSLMVNCKPMENKVVQVYHPDKFQIMVYGVELHNQSGMECGHFTLFGSDEIAFKFVHPEINVVDIKGVSSKYFSKYYLISSDVPVYGYNILNNESFLSDNFFHIFPGFNYSVNVKSNLGVNHPVKTGNHFIFLNKLKPNK